MSERLERETGGPLASEVDVAAKKATRYSPLQMHKDLLGLGRGGRARPGDVREAIIRLLDEGPKHGYQIIRELSARSGGVWRPSPGSVYPTLQSLEGEGLATAEQAGGKRPYRITGAGSVAAAEAASAPAPWDAAAQAQLGDVLHTAGDRLATAMRQVAEVASEEQRARAAQILVQARKDLYAILAED
jgi:DNA-binding PadR family transcriptional regulator